MKYEVETIDGRERIWFPAISYHRMDTNQLVKYPPLGNVNYKIIYHDKDVADELTKIGLTRDPRHTGRMQVEIIDNRNVVQ